MFRLSKASEYGIRGILYLSKHPLGTVCFSSEIAEDQEIPRSFLPKVFQTLARKGLIKSVRGSAGGFILLKSPASISMFDVIDAMEGPIFLNECMIHEGYCHRDNVCPVHLVWADLQREFIERLKKTNFETLHKKGAELLSAPKKAKK